MKTKFLDIYGIKDMELRDAARSISDTLGIKMQERDSSFKGIYYCFDDYEANEGFELVSNFNEFEEDFL